MRFRLPKGYAIEVDRFAMAAAGLAVVANVAFIVSLAMAWDVDVFLSGWGANALVAAMTGYVLFRMTGGSLATAPRFVRSAIRSYFLVGGWFLAAVIWNMALHETGRAVVLFTVNTIAPGVVVSVVLGLLFLVAGNDGGAVNQDSSPERPGVE